MAEHPYPEGPNRAAPKLLLHDFLREPFGRDTCDAKLDDAGRIRTCTRPAREHLDQQPIGSLPVKLPGGLTVKREGPYVEINDALLGVMLLGPHHALAFARAIIFAAHEKVPHG